MRDKNGTVQHSVVLDIGELALNIPSSCQDGLRAKSPYFAKLCAAEFNVRVEFSYTRGEEARTWGHPDDQHDGAPAEVSIKAIRADAAVHFDGDGVSLTAERGTDLLPLFSHNQIAALEDKLLARAAAGSDE